MLFARVASFFFAVVTFGLFALANPVPSADKRAVDPMTLVTNLQSTVMGITSQLRKIIQRRVSSSLTVCNRGHNHEHPRERDPRAGTRQPAHHCD